MKISLCRISALVVIAFLAGCAALSAGRDQYRDSTMDFASIKTIAVLPLTNVSRDSGAADRVRDVLANSLLATGGVYVLPPGEVARGIYRAGIVNASAPSVEEVQKLTTIIKVNAVIVGTIKEYGDMHAGSASANVISLSLQMIETQTGKIVWSASTTEGGITAWDRLFGGGGKPMNDITEKAVNDLIEMLFK